MQLLDTIVRPFKLNTSDVRLKQRLQRLEGNRFFIIAVCTAVGLLAGLASVCMHELAGILSRTLAMLRTNEGLFDALLIPAIPALAILLCVLFGRLLFRKSGYKTSLTEAVHAARQRQGFLPFYHTFCHIFTSGLSVGCGISAGMEAPSALTGAAIGSNISRWLHFNRETRTLLLCAGSAAGIAAVFNSPLAGVLFACEILLPSVSAVSLIPLLIASAAAAILAHSLGGNTTVPDVPLAWNTSQILHYVALGLLTGFVSVFVINLNLKLHNLAKKLTNTWLKAALGGAILYIFFLAFPSLMGQGDHHIQSLFTSNVDNLPIRALGVLLRIDPTLGLILAIGLLSILKPLVSSVSLESGGDGGIFGPSLFIGAFFGYFFCAILDYAEIATLPCANCVALGMAGVLAGVMHAPLTGLFLIAELFGSYEMLIPLMVVVALSTLVSKVISKTNIYVSFISNDADKKDEDQTAEELSRFPVRNFTDKNYYPLLPTDTLHQLLEVIVKSRKSLFPVLDQNNHLLGIVREEHIRPFIFNDQLHYHFIVEDFMSSAIQTIPAEATLHEATQIFDAAHCWFLAVIEKDGSFLGFISKTELLNNYRQFMVESALF